MRININPLSWWGSKAYDDERFPRSQVAARRGTPLGPWTTAFDDWVAREVAPRLYEAIREAIPPIDGAINRMVTLDGIIRARGANDRLVSEIEAWMRNVRVNDMEAGLQAFYRLAGNEHYEQGFSVGDFVMASAGNDIERLRIADSKGVLFRRANGELEVWYAPPGPDRNIRRDGTEQVERVLRNSWTTGNLGAILNTNGYRRLQPEALVYSAFNPEADNPYGTSIMRSMEFDAKVLLVIKNALYQTWERFGDPIFNVTYKTKRRIDEADLEARRSTIAKNLASVLKIKRSGNAADLVNAVGKEDEIKVEVLGADGQVLEVEAPARHILEQIVSKTGLPSWMLGFHWSTAERLAQRQGEIALQESKTRFETRKPGLEKIVATMLRARGRTWRQGDWELYQELPSLQDLVAQAQARFLDAQTDMMRGNTPDQAQAAKVTQSGHIVLPTDDGYPLQIKHRGGRHRCKVEAYVEDEDNLMRLERRVERALLSAWDGLYDDMLDVLGVASAAKMPEPLFIFDAAGMTRALLDLERDFVNTVGGKDADLARSSYQAWMRGVTNAATEIGADAVDEQARAAAQMEIETRALELVKNTSVRTLRDDVIATLSEGVYDGLNPSDVARALRKRFDAHVADWERLARSEIADAQSGGKMRQYAAHGLEEYDWIPAGDACPICMARANDGPYKVGAGPRPMRDSHPNCRCTIEARVS